MLNIGTKPTIQNSSEKTVEAHIIDFRGDIYGKTIRIFFVKKIRNEQKFPSLSALQAQLEKDRCLCKTIAVSPENLR